MGRLHQDDVRKKIQVSQLLNVLQDHALGETAEIPASRMKAIEILLRKSLPDLSSIEHTGIDGGPLETVTRVELVPLAGRGDSAG
jgi:hypothetical protein